MKFLRSNRCLWIAFLAFIILNAFLYIFIIQNHASIPLNRADYSRIFHHFIPDQRIKNKPFNLFNALAQADAQWYLKIAKSGYPLHPKNLNIKDKTAMDGLTYAFFPLYPIAIAFVNTFIGNVEVSAFILVTTILIANFFSLYFVLLRISNKMTALKTIFLLFFFPLSIFYRSYYVEGLFLLLLVWFSWFLFKKKWIYSAIFLALLNITKANGFLLNILFLYLIYREILKRKISIIRTIFAIAIIITPFVMWMVFCFLQTGNFFYFLKVRKGWYEPTFPIITLLYNLGKSLFFPFFPFHSVNFSMVDSLAIYLILIILIISRKSLNKKLWWISFALWIFPLLTTDSVSYSRYQIVSFPLFLFLAQKLNNAVYVCLLAVSIIGLFVVSLYFVNWYWIG